MVNDALAGRVPDYSESLKSKTRSVHNTYFTFPVLFIMLSNHFPSIYNHALNAFMLVGLSVAGALVRHAMVTKKPFERWLLLPASIILAALIFATAKTSEKISSRPGPVSFIEVKAVFVKHCHSCHSSSPQDEIFKVPPKGLVLETEAQIRAVAEKVYTQVVEGKIMPLGNKTLMSEEERALIGRWLSQ